MLMLKGLALVLVAWAGGPVQKDLLELKSGQKIEAAVLKEEPDALFLDLGFDVLRVPTASINKRTHKGDVKPAIPGAETDCFLTAAPHPHRQRTGGHVRRGSRPRHHARRPRLGLHH